MRSASALSLRRWWRSAGFAWAGVRHAYRTQPNFRLEVWAGAAALGLGSVSVGKLDGAALKLLLPVPEDEHPLYFLIAGRL